MRRLSPFSNNHLYVSLLMDNTHAENAQFAFVFGETITHALLA